MLHISRGVTGPGNVRPDSTASLLEWIARRGGIIDTGGEVTALDLDTWHKGKIGRRERLTSTGALIPGMTALPPTPPTA